MGRKEAEKAYQVVFASFIGAILDLAAERRGLHFCSRMGHIRRATSWAGNAIACAAVSLILVMARPSVWRAGCALGATHNGYGGGGGGVVHGTCRKSLRKSAGP